jgi:hypothetical protein
MGLNPSKPNNPSTPPSSMSEPTTSPPINHQRQTYIQRPNSSTTPYPSWKPPSKYTQTVHCPHWNPLTPRYHTATTQTHHHVAATQNQSNHHATTSHCTTCIARAPGLRNAPPTIVPPRLHLLASTINPLPRQHFDGCRQHRHILLLHPLPKNCA